MALHLPAHAKVNLHLRVVGRRPDGYHELETLLHQIELHDELFCDERPGSELSLAVRGCGLSAGDDNLVLRAAAAYLAAAGLRRGFSFLLRKRIPIGAGLGGGSADAAAALRLLDASCEGALAAERLFEVARGLGADVPFFLAGGTQWGTGVGDRLLPVRGAPSLHFLLVLPPLSCSTAAVYKNHRAELIPGRGAASIPVSKVLFYKELQVRGQLINDLEAAATELYPELREISDRAAHLGYPDLRLTGSGSASFLAFASAAEVETARGRLAGLEACNGVRFLATRSLAGALRPPASVPWPKERV